MTPIPTASDPSIELTMPYLKSEKSAAVTYLDEVDDKSVLKVVRQIRRRGNLPDVKVAEERPHVMYSLDGEVIGSYKVEINTDAASISVDIDSPSAVNSASAVASTRPRRQKPKKRPDMGVPAPRYTYNEALQEDILEDFYLVPYNHEGVTEPKKKISPPKKSPERRQKSHQIIASAASPKRVQSPKGVQSQLGLNLLCGCMPVKKVRKPTEEPDGPPRSELRRSMNSLREEARWLYDDVLGTESDSDIYGDDHESTSSNKEAIARGGVTSRGLMRLWAGLGEKKVDENYSEDDSSSDDDDDDDFYFDVDDIKSEMGSLTLASTESSSLAQEHVTPRGSRTGHKSSRLNAWA
jgi:hypothetical protein